MVVVTGRLVYFRLDTNKSIYLRRSLNGCLSLFLKRIILQYFPD